MVAASRAPVVFVSYSHEESGIVLAFADALAGRGLRVIIDRDHLKPGDDVAEFARQSVRAADATICVVSTTSLSSPWVGFEAVITLYKEHGVPDARLIACTTDGAFLQHEFRLEVTKSIDDRLGAIGQTLRRYLDEHLDMNDLAMERSRLMNLRSNLGDVLARLRGSLTLTLRPDTLVDCATKVADRIRELRGQLPSRHDPRDICARAEELRRHIWEGRTDDALDRMLDFVREFSDRPGHITSVTLCANVLRRLDKAERERRATFAEVEGERQPVIVKLLELIDEIEVHPQLPLAS